MSISLLFEVSRYVTDFICLSPSWILLIICKPLRMQVISIYFNTGFRSGGLKSNECYLLRAPATQQDEGDCENLGGHLTSIHDSATNDYIGGNLAKLVKANPLYTSDMVWIGGGSECFNDTYCRWYWEDETSFDFQAFAPGQNAKRNDQSTMYAVTFNISNNLWYAYDEDSPKYYNLFPYLCKVPPQAGPPPCPEGAFAGVNGDDCFMFHKDPVDWGTAKYNGCNDSKLASIQDAFENKLITSQLVNLSNNISTKVWLGGYTEYQCNSCHTNCGNYWNWDDGTDFSYTNFAPGHEDENPDQVLVINTLNGKWYGEGDTKKYPYLCKVRSSKSKSKKQQSLGGCPGKMSNVLGIF
uniref:C-type lectin domain-containing protein n=1 Tax=Acrobeloides nanus TaxID=290746 RepID=A0A914EEB0_9BILA